MTSFLCDLLCFLFLVFFYFTIICLYGSQTQIFFRSVFQEISWFLWFQLKRKCGLVLEQVLNRLHKQTKAEFL